MHWNLNFGFWFGMLLAPALSRLRVRGLAAAMAMTTAAAAAAGGTAADLNGRLSAAAFARKGPLWPTLHDSGATATFTFDEWDAHGVAIASQLSPEGVAAALSVEELEPQLAIRIHHLYLPIYFWARAMVRTQQQQQRGGAVALGLSAPQGCGKTTLVELLVERFAADGLGCAAVSFDDFYLRGADQDALAAAHEHNPLLQVRGNAGTHDLALGSETLAALTGRGRDGGAASGAAVRIPRYDKSARGGRGDRAPEAGWAEVASPPQVVLLEGWMAGFAPLEPSAPVLRAQAGLAEVNDRLGAYAAWHDMMDGWVVLGVDDAAVVYEWRLQAERAMAASGRPGMSDDQVADFVSRYMPAYQAYLPGLYEAAGGGGVGGKPSMLVRVDGSRAPIAGAREQDQSPASPGTCE